MTNISIIVAIGDNNIIGNNGKIPWNIQEDKDFFKKTVNGQNIIVGRITYNSMPKIKEYENISIVSSQLKNGYDSVSSAIKAIKQTKKETQNIFIAGGHNIYKEGLKYANQLIISRIKGNFKGDTYFPKIPEKFKLQKSVKKEKFKIDYYKI